MKTVTGKIISSTPVSISKAASVISKFISKDTGASPAICAYLRRATAAFDELSRLHSKSGSRKHKKHKSDARETSSRPELTNGVKEEERGDRLVDEGKTVNNVKDEQSQAETVQKKKKKEKEKEKEGEKAEIGNAGSFVDNGAEDEEKEKGHRLANESKTVNKVKEEQSQAATEQKKKKKDNHKEKFEIGSASNFSENGGEVVDRREDGVKVEIKEEGEKNGGKIGIDEEKLDEKNKKKRKNRDFKEEEKDGSQDQLSKKNKKRKKQSGKVDN